MRKLRGDVEYEVGRRMTTSPGNRVSPSHTVTQDCVLQLEKANGLVAEAKLGLPKNEELWDSHIKQLEKYDDDLTGWWTPDEKTPTHDLVALVPLSRAVRFADRLESGAKGGKWTFERRVAVIGFFKTSGVKDFLSLKKEWGALSSADLDQRLRESRQVDIDLLITKYRDRKFVDHMPPQAYLLQIIWDHLFTRYAADALATDTESPVSLEVSPEKVTADLQEYFGFKSNGPRSPEIPSIQWVRKALDALVAFKLATKSGDQQYVISYKRTKSDTLRKFGKLCSQRDQTTNSTPATQLPLLPSPQDGPS
jgi:hypothetical protein